MYSTDATPGIDSASRVTTSRAASVRLSSSWAVTATLLSMNSRPALRPLITMNSAASSTSIRITVAVAARLIIALRQKPCQARTTLNPMKRANAIGSVLPLVGGRRLVSHEVARLECQHPATHGVHDLLVVRGHQHGRAELVDLDEELNDLPAGDGVEVAGRLVGDEDRRIVDERAGDGGPLLLPARQLRREVVGVLVQP